MTAPDDDSRLKSAKAVAAALILAGILALAAAVFLWVVLSRACAGPTRAGAVIPAGLREPSPSL